MTKIAFDIKELQEFLDKQGCDCCIAGWLHVVGSDIVLDWESNIQYVITKYHDIELVGELIEEEKK